jgi:hypothetical protein
VGTVVVADAAKLVNKRLTWPVIMSALAPVTARLRIVKKEEGSA